MSFLILQSSRWGSELVALLLCYEYHVAVIDLLTLPRGAISWFTSLLKLKLSRDMRFPTMWYVRPAKPQISLGIQAV